MIACPLDLVQQVSQVRSYRDVVLPRSELAVEMFIVSGILLEDNTVSGQQVRKSVRCHCAVNVYLILVLVVITEDRQMIRQTHTHVTFSVSVVIRTKSSPWRNQRKRRVWPTVRRDSRRVWKRRSWWMLRLSCQDEPGKVWPTPVAPADCLSLSKMPWHSCLATVARSWPEPTSCPDWLCWMDGHKDTTVPSTGEQ